MGETKFNRETAKRCGALIRDATRGVRFARCVEDVAHNGPHHHENLQRSVTWPSSIYTIASPSEGSWDFGPVSERLLAAEAKRGDTDGE